MVRLAAVLAISLAAVSAAVAQASAPLPREIEAARREAAAACTGRVTFEPGYIQTADFNGDGRPDYLINEEKVKGPGSPPLFCGSGGCSWALYLSTAGGYRKVLDGLDYQLTIEPGTPPTLRTEGRGGNARHRWNGRAMAQVRGR